MKFILFNAFVIAALGYILFERGALEGSPAGEIASKAVAAIEDKAEPLLAPSGTSEPQVQDRTVRPQREQREEVVAAQSPAVSQDTPAPNPAPAAPEVAAETAALAEASPQVDPRVLAEPVAPEVAARRAVVLGGDRDSNPRPAPASAPAVAEDKPKISAAERKQRLRAIADEAELLSIELISR